MIAFMPAGAGAVDRTVPNLDRPHPILTSLVTQQPDTTYRVRPGDSLSRIAGRTLGDRRKWPLLWFDNRHLVHNPNLITPGERLRIPSSHHMTKHMVHLAAAALPPPPAPPPSAAPPQPTVTVQQSAPVHHGRHRRHHFVATQQPVAAQATYSGGTGFEACVIAHESGGNPSAVNPTSGAGGLYQFLPSTWAKLGYAGQYPGGAQTAPVSVQRAAFEQLYAEAGTAPWAPYDGC